MPDSYLVLALNSAAPQPAHEKVPARFSPFSGLRWEGDAGHYGDACVRRSQQGADREERGAPAALSGADQVAGGSGSWPTWREGTARCAHIAQSVLPVALGHM